VSKVRVLSFTVPQDKGWSAVTPSGLVTAERGVQVTILITETWDHAAQTIAAHGVAALMKPEPSNET
jgi:hypothetical protein